MATAREGDGEKNVQRANVDGGGEEKLLASRNAADFIYVFPNPPSVTALSLAAYLQAFSLPCNPRRTWGSTIRTPRSPNTMPRV